MKKNIISLGKILFKIRGVTPIPFYLMCLIFSGIEFSFLLPGLLLIGSGEILRIFSVGYLGLASRKTEEAGADELVISGPYRFARNPIYLGNMSIYLGFAVLSNVFFPVFAAVTLVFFMFVYYFITRYEESVLQLKFGRNYENYLLSVPRFFPHTPTKLQIVTLHRFDPVKALRSEKVTLFVLVLALSVILIKNYTF